MYTEEQVTRLKKQYDKAISTLAKAIYLTNWVGYDIPKKCWALKDEVADEVAEILFEHDHKMSDLS